MGKGLINLTNLNSGISVPDLDFGPTKKDSAPVYIKTQDNSSA